MIILVPYCCNIAFDLTFVAIVVLITISILSDSCLSYASTTFQPPLLQQSQCNSQCSSRTTATRRIRSEKHYQYSRPSFIMLSSIVQNDVELDDIQPSNVSSVLLTHDENEGLYRPFAQYAWQTLLQTDKYSLSMAPIDSELSYKEVATPGGGGGGGISMNSSIATTTGSKVRITIQAASSNQQPDTRRSMIQYARFALIETIGSSPLSVSNTQNSEKKLAMTHADGIQVLNLVVIPYQDTGLPVFGADFVSLPGNKHLLLLDAQPVRNHSNSTATNTNKNTTNTIDNWFQQWYERNQIKDQYVWGGDLPEPVQQYVSKYALWTRFGTSNDKLQQQQQQKVQQENPVQIIQGPIMELFIDHFQTYMQLLDYYNVSSSLHKNDRTPPTAHSDTDEESATTNSRLLDYLQYRLDNDPARPMLKRLFGTEWTEQVLHDILFPIHTIR